MEEERKDALEVEEEAKKAAEEGAEPQSRQVVALYSVSACFYPGFALSWFSNRCSRQSAV